jgi:hypothetical protein
MAEAERTVGFALMSSGIVMVGGGNLPPPENYAPSLWGAPAKQN